MNRSETIAKLAAALVAFNGEVSKIEKDSVNPHFRNKYASLDNIIDEIRPILTKHGLNIIQMPSGDGETLTMSTLLLHESGEFIESPPLTMRPSKNDPQGIGSCATYARRYSLAAFLSLNTGEDDDGNAASGPRQKIDNVPLIGSKEEAQEAGAKKLAEQKAKAAYNNTPTPTGDKISEAQLKLFANKAKQAGFISPEQVTHLKADLLEKFGVSEPADIPKSKFNAALTWIQEQVAPFQLTGEPNSDLPF